MGEQTNNLDLGQLQAQKGEVYAWDFAFSVHL